MKPILLFMLLTNLFGDYGEHPIPEEPEEAYPENFLNLRHMAQDFFLETWEVFIPGYKQAFNPGIVRYKNSVLMSFRLRDERGISTFQMGLVWLDDNLKPIGTPQVLDIPKKFPNSPEKYQDPRLITVGEKLYIVFSNMIDETFNGREIRRMFFSEVLHDGQTFTVLPPQCLCNFEGESPQRWEKNWNPFAYKDHLLFAYELLPHRIFYSHEGKCELFATSTGEITWNWGTLRGSTPALLEGDEYLSFFHSCKNLPTVQSKGKNITHYFIGAYTYSAEPPFQITKISPEPIMAKNFYNGPPQNTWKPLRVVFPCGHITEGNSIYLAYGRQDHECWIAKIDKQGLLNSLVPVTTK